MGVYQIDKLMGEARRLATAYRRATGKTLAISGEIAISDAITLLGLEAAPTDAEGYDALRNVDGECEKIQIWRAPYSTTRAVPIVWVSSSWIKTGTSSCWS